MSIAGVRVRGRILSATHAIDDGVVSVAGERITAVHTFAEWAARHPNSAEPLFEGVLLPGLVDIHVHGGAGHRFDTVDQGEAAGAAEYHRKRGSTTVLAGIVSAAPDDMVAQVAALRELAESGVIGGIYAEGPFLAGIRCGAHDPRYLIDPDAGLVRRLLAAAGGHLRMMTLAPELPGFDSVARLLADHGVTVSLGHSDADFACFRAAMRPQGPASSVTHLGNGMPPLHHRSAGPVAAALTAAAGGAASVELIGDGVHVDAGFGALAFAAAPGRVALITDAMAAAGMPDGTYRLGSQDVQVSEGVARIAGGSIAGGTAHLLRCVAWAVRECGVPLADAVRAATATPAGIAGLADIGEVRAGGYADLLVVDHDLALRRVLSRGRWL
ncbi:N-acetylglucosamine-6-phosphate deacetylase [Nocardia sp. NBC_01327]|uniref:N-acetylglucosamine-6-phosphate deacetylase n=1 Tax=Nocardia sp. NBC_01327 TaxID=2903593 RepID=UPI002E0F9ED2|nr:amidohydrolase family protein [Nocardia sp. NBC_01327]